MVSITYDDLIELQLNYGLTAGEQYRITDYVTTVDDNYQYVNPNQQAVPLVRSTGHPFDVVVTAVSTSTLSTDATALPRSGDVYFTLQDLSGWRLKYMTEYGEDGNMGMYDVAPWAIQSSADGGKGAIYWMRDEYGNEAGYDFKNIQFCRYTIYGELAMSDKSASEVEVQDFYTKLLRLYNDRSATARWSMLEAFCHCFAGYAAESEIYDAEDTWGSIYTLSSSGTRIFVKFYSSDDKPYIIAEVRNPRWFHTFGYMQSQQASSTSDLSLSGTVRGCVVAQALNVYNDGYELPASIFLTKTDTQEMENVSVPTGFFCNTVKMGFTGLTIQQSVTNSLFYDFETIVVNGPLNTVTILDASGYRNIYETNYDILFWFSLNYWRIPFVTLNNQTYEVRIYGAEGSTPITLQGAAKPITTQEDISTDVFLPLRTQTGYVNVIVGSDFDYTELLPVDNLSRPVTLIDTDGNGLLWKGFLKAQNFNLPFTEYNITLKLPIIDSFSSLDNVPFSPNMANPYINLASILYYALTVLDTYEQDPFLYVYIGNSYNMISSESAMLLAKVATSMFYEYEDGKMVSKYSCSEVIQQVALFLGVTIRSAGDTIYLIAPGDPTYAGMVGATISIADLKTVADGTPVSAPMYRPQSVRLFDAAQNPYADTSNRMKVLQGCREVQISCEQSLSSMSFDMPKQDIADRYYATHEPTRTVIDHKQLYTLYHSGIKFYSNEEYTVRFFSCKLHIWQLTDQAIFNFDWNVGIEVPGVVSHYYTEDAFMFRTRNPVFLKDCIIEIQGSGGIYDNGELNTACSGNVPFIIQVGDYYFTESRWGTTKVATAFSTISDGDIVCNRELTSKDAAYTGYGAAVKEDTLPAGVDHLMGYLTVIVQKGAIVPTGTTGAYPFTWTDLKLNILPNVKAGESYDGDKKYKEQTANRFSKVISKNLIFVNDNGVSPLTNKVVGITETDPPAQLAKNIMAYNGTTRSIFELCVLKSVSAVTPGNVVSRGSKTYYPVSISEDWRDRKQNIILAELPSTV